MIIFTKIRISIDYKVFILLNVHPAEKVNLLIDGTWFPNKVCLIVYRADNLKATLFYRLTDNEREMEIIADLKALIPTNKAGQAACFICGV